MDYIREQFSNVLSQILLLWLFGKISLFLEDIC